MGSNSTAVTKPDRDNGRGGKLKTGNPGNRGNTAPRRPGLGNGLSVATRAQARAAAAEAFLARVPALATIADESAREPETHETAIRAIDTLGKYGLASDRLDAEDVRQRLRATVQSIYAELDEATANRLLAVIHPHWIA